MIRATTPLQEFSFETDPSAFTRILITYTQNDEIVLEKNKGDLSFTTTTDDDGNTVYVAYYRMTQAEANLFEPEPARVQVRVLTGAGEALASDISTIRITDVLNDEVLS